MIRILLVDDEPDILEFIGYNLEKEGFQVLKALNGREAIEVAKRELPQIIILDVMMPEMDGMVTCEEIRKIPELKQSIIAFLTARGEDYSQIAGFEAGADDYITKPIRPKVLVSRVRALLKRYQPEKSSGPEQPDEVLTVGDLTIDRERYLIIKHGQEMNLPKKEFELLSLLVSKPGKVFTRDDIYDTVWGDEVIVGDRTIDVHIRKLREKIGDDQIKTIKGVGYKFVVDSNKSY
ncbi:MAG: response regulator transcription factor [Bacteroidetes bacterium]|nr:response regulator transcription factor [Bacteroidota bacterium]